VKPENNSDWRRLWENREALPSASHRRFLGSLIAGLKRLFGPLGDFFLSARLETQREFNLHMLLEQERLQRGLEEIRAGLTRLAEETLPSLQADVQNTQTHFQAHFSELQNEILTLRDEKIPALLKGQELGLKGADMKAEWALARIIQLRQMLEKGVPLAAKEKSAAARGLVYAQFEDEFRRRSK